MEDEESPKQLMTLSTLSPSVDLLTIDNDPFMLTKELTLTVSFVNFSILSTSIAIFGVITNIVNMTVFIKQGFRDTVNISLFTLALSDMLSLTILIWVGFCFNPASKDIPNLPINPREAVYLTGGQPRLYFTRVAGWITTLVSIERCVCVIKPLKVKFIFTSQRLVGMQVVIFVLAFATMIPVYYTSKLGWKFDSSQNETYIGLIFMENRHVLDRITHAMGVTISLAAFVSVSVCTFILSSVLIRQSQWRAKAMREAVSTTNNAKSNSDAKGQSKNELSNRDIQVVRTVTFIAAIFVICYFPNAVGQATMSIVPTYNFGAKYKNLFIVSWSFAQMTEAISSSINIFVYYKTSTKFKETIHTMTTCKRAQ